MMRRMILEEPVAEAKKAEGASRVVLLIPSPPKPTGRDAWVYAWLSPKMSMFTISIKSDLECESKLCSSGEQKHGEVLNVYRTFGTANACRRRQ